MQIHEIVDEQLVFKLNDFYEIDDVDDSYTSKKIKGSTIFKGVNSAILEINNADHTVLDSEYYNIYAFHNLSADRNFNLPTHADNEGKRFKIINTTGTYKVVVTPEDRGGGDIDYINEWQETFEITEQGGVLEVFWMTDHWEAMPNENCCKYEVSSETADTGLTVDGTWDDVANMALTPPVGKFLLYAYGGQYIHDTGLPAYLFLYFGLGTTAGNNAPNISKAYKDAAGFQVTANNAYSFGIDRNVVDVEYTSTGVTIYMKAKALSEESPATLHRMQGAAGIPMYIKAKRIR